jgi:subtilisin family serine protease
MKAISRFGLVTVRKRGRLNLAGGVAAFGLLLFALGLIAAAPGQAREAEDARFVPGELLVRFERQAEQADRAAALGEVNAETRERLFVPGLRLVEVEGIPVPRAAALLDRQPGVRYAEPNYIDQLDAIPNDTYFGSLWALHNTGQGVNGVFGTADADIDAVEAWDVHRGSPGVIVGIADTGVFYNHPDLAPNLYSNPGESGGGKASNGIDDDGNGFVDDFRGWDFFGNDNDPAPPNPGSLPQAHGTRVASAAGARGNNGLGVTGSAQEVALLPLRVGDTSAFVSHQISAYGYAHALGAKVVNLSAGGPGFSQARLDAIRAAASTLFVFAAGNDSSDNNVTPQYPCGHNEPNVVCVAATDQDDKLASFSNFGTAAVDLAAPGVNILTATIGTDPASSYHFSNGTSFAAPIVAGAAAVYRSRYPGARALDTRNALRQGVDVLASLNDRVETNGRLNLARTLSIVPADSTPPQTTITSGPAGSIRNRNPSFAFVSSETISSFSCRLDGGAWTSCSSPKGYSDLPDGPHGFAVRARDAAGNTDPSPATRSFTVDTIPPVLKLSGQKAQRLGRAVKVRAACNEACRVGATGTVLVRPGAKGSALRGRGVPLRVRLKPASAALGAGENKTLKLKLSGKKRKRVKRALEARGAKAKARLKAAAADAAGNEATAKRTVKLKR